MRKCGEMRKDGGREWRGFDHQSGDFPLYLSGSGVFKGLFQKVLSKTAWVDWRGRRIKIGIYLFFSFTKM